MAFIMEVLRLRPGSPLGVDHETGVDTETRWPQTTQRNDGFIQSVRTEH